MPISQAELGRRLRAAREACRFTQDEVANRLDLSRSTIAQIELGNRAVTGLELDRLAYLYGREIREFLAEQFEEDDALVALFRAHPDLSNQEDLLKTLRHCLALGREVTNLERILANDRDIAALPTYDLPNPRSKWEAIEQGQRVANDERGRLGLGAAPVPNITELLEMQGVRTAQVRLPEDVSGVMIAQRAIGLLVAVNVEHSLNRRRFSYAHEYSHALLDRARKGTISRTEERDDMIEVRANSFAANFLMPKEGVREFIQSLGKGQPSRLQAEVYDEDEAVPAQARSTSGSQELQLYDVAHVAHHFGVSRLSAIYRLRNLRYITDSQRDQFKSVEELGGGPAIAELLGLPDPDKKDKRNEFVHHFLGLALEAYRREGITLRKLRELADLIGFPQGHLEKLLEELGMREDDGAEVVAPGE